MRITILTMIAFELNAALDSGKHEISFHDVHRHLQAGSVFSFLKQRLGAEIDLSLLMDDKEQLLVSEWQGFSNAIDSRRKFGVQKNGLCLLLAYAIQSIQQRQDNNASQL